LDGSSSSGIYSGKYREGAFSEVRYASTPEFKKYAIWVIHPLLNGSIMLMHLVVGIVVLAHRRKEYE
jgi:hypothetical protein